MLHGDLLRIEYAGGTSWRLLRSSQGHAPDDDDDDDDDDLKYLCARRLLQLWLFPLHDAPHLATDHRVFPIIGARLWNSLPDDITTATSLVTFRHQLETFLFRRPYHNVDA